jgi:hypothetical protein
MLAAFYPARRAARDNPLARLDRPRGRETLARMTYPGVDESFERLRRAGWSVGGCGTAALWVVSGSNGENAIRAPGRAQAAAWWRACGQTRAMGMLAPSAFSPGPTVKRVNRRTLTAFLTFAALWWPFTAASRCDGGRPRPTELSPVGRPAGRE